MRKRRTRVYVINELIKAIAAQERSFFLSKSNTGLIANFQLTSDDKLYYQDEEGEKRQITPKTDSVKLMDWVHHGSTLRQQVIDFAQFIFSGKPQRVCSRYWGVSLKSQEIIHQKAFDIGFIDSTDFEFHDYGKSKDIKGKVKS